MYLQRHGEALHLARTSHNNNSRDLQVPSKLLGGRSRGSHPRRGIRLKELSGDLEGFGFFVDEEKKTH